MKTWKTWIAVAAVGAIGVGFAAQTMAQGMGGMRGQMGNAPTFAELDADGNGQVSIEEAKAFADGRFAAMDADGDGALSADELSAHFAAQIEAQMQARVERMIAWQDDNGDGVLSADEMPEVRMQGMFNRLDADGDNQISEEEFAALGEGRGMGDRGERGHGGKTGKGGHGGHGGGHR